MQIKYNINALDFMIREAFFLSCLSLELSLVPHYICYLIFAKPHKPGCSLPIQIVIKASMAGGVGSAAVVDQMGSGRGMVMDSINELTIL